MDDARARTIAQLKARMAAIEAGAGPEDTPARSGRPNDARAAFAASPAAGNVPSRASEPDAASPLAGGDAVRQAVSRGFSRAARWSEGSAPNPCDQGRSAVSAGQSKHSGSSRFGAASDSAAADQAFEPDESPEEELRRALKKVERLCAVREQASAPLKRRLVADGFSEESAEEAVACAVRWGYVDDARYADALVRSRLAAGKGCVGIARELSEAGIDPSSVASLLDAEADDDAESERALALLRRKPPRAKNAREAAYRRLVQKGFSSSTAARAARRWQEETGA